MTEMKKINDKEVEKVSGGGYAQSQEIIAYFRSHGYEHINPYDDNDLDLFLMDVLGGTKLKDYTIMTNYTEDSDNSYFTEDNQRISHAEFMKRLREEFGQ